MTPEKKATNIYLNLYKHIGCAAKTKRCAMFMIDTIIEEVDIKDWWEEVKRELNKL